MTPAPLDKSDQLFFIPFEEFERVRHLTCSPVEKTALFSSYCRINTLYMITAAGSGHPGSSFSSIDIVAWLLLNELRSGPDGDESFRDIYFSSKGHDVPGLYAVLIGLGLLDFAALHKLRKKGGLPGHPDVSTPGISANTGSLGMGISKAKGMVLASRLSGRDDRVFVMTGDGELQEGQIWESLMSAANRRMDELTVIVDHNKIQSDTWVQKTLDLGDLERKFAAFGWHVVRTEGHDFENMAAAFDETRAHCGQPHVIIADTVKGGGISQMVYPADAPDDTLYPYHSGAPDRTVYQAAFQELLAQAEERWERLDLPAPKLETAPFPEKRELASPQRLIQAYTEGLMAQAESRKDLVVLDADLKLDCGLIPFEKTYRDRFIECGIAEQDMVSQAGGLALRGYLPVVHSFACFLSTRPNEQIYNNATEKTKVIYVGCLAGVLPGMPGHSHQSVRDISALAAIPGLVLVEPCCETEVKAVTDWAVNGSDQSTYIRLVSVPWETSFDLPPTYALTQGKGTVLMEGTDAVLFGYGPFLLDQACRAAGELERTHGISVKVVNLPWLNMVDVQWLKETVGNIENVFTLDNHYIKGGQGEMIAATLAGLDEPVSRRSFAMGINEVPVCGRTGEVLAHHRLDDTAIERNILEQLKKRGT